MQSVQHSYIVEQTTLAVSSKIRHTISTWVDCLSKAIEAARIAEEDPTNREEILKILTDR